MKRTADEKSPAIESAINKTRVVGVYGKRNRKLNPTELYDLCVFCL